MVYGKEDGVYIDRNYFFSRERERERESERERERERERESESERERERENQRAIHVYFYKRIHILHFMPISDLMDHEIIMDFLK